MEEAQHSRRHLWELELDAFGTSHAEIGAYLMGLWSLEKSIIEAIAFHHRPAMSMNANLALLTAVHVGNAMGHKDSAEADLPMDSRLDTGYLDSLGITTQVAQWQSVCEPLPESTLQ